MNLGLALGSGGARGWCHIGVLRALEEQGVKPDVVAGCSMGALVGAAWAAGRLDALEDWARGLSKTRFLGYVDLRLDGGGLVKGQAISDVLEDIGLPDRIEDLPRPFLAVATDMATGREVWLREGPLIPAVRASISIPGVFSPQELDGRWLLDGGLINPVPTSATRALGATCTIAVNPNAKQGRKLWTPSPSTSFWDRLDTSALEAHLPKAVSDLLPNRNGDGSGGDDGTAPAYVDVVSASIDILTEFLRQARHAADPPHLLLDADLVDMPVMELFRAAEAIDEGARITSAAKEQIAALV